jgi:aspartate racemase
LGHEVGLVALLDSFPSCESNELSLSERAAKKVEFWKRRIEGHWKEIHPTRISQWPDYLRRKLKTLRRRARSRAWQIAFQSYGSSNNELPKVFQDVKESNYLAFKRYVTKPYSGKVTVFMAAQHRPSTAEFLQTAWNDLAKGGVELHEVPGDHVTMIEEPHAEALAQSLRKCLDAFRAGTPTREDQSPQQT